VDTAEHARVSSSSVVEIVTEWPRPFKPGDYGLQLTKIQPATGGALALRRPVW
jgi:hypothetical protein